MARRPLQFQYCAQRCITQSHNSPTLLGWLLRAVAGSLPPSRRDCIATNRIASLDTVRSLSCSRNPSTRRRAVFRRTRCRFAPNSEPKMALSCIEKYTRPLSPGSLKRLRFLLLEAGHFRVAKVGSIQHANQYLMHILPDITHQLHRINLLPARSQRNV